METPYIYEVECPVCDSICKVAVPYDDDRPLCCPMCGEEVEYEKFEEEEEDDE